MGRRLGLGLGLGLGLANPYPNPNPNPNQVGRRAGALPGGDHRRRPQGRVARSQGRQAQAGLRRARGVAHRRELVTLARWTGRPGADRLETSEQKSTRTNQPTRTSTIWCHKQGHRGEGMGARQARGATGSDGPRERRAISCARLTDCTSVLLYGGALPPACAPQLGHAGLCRLWAVGRGARAMSG